MNDSFDLEGTPAWSAACATLLDEMAAHDADRERTVHMKPLARAQLASALMRASLRRLQGNSLNVDSYEPVRPARLH